MVSVSHGAFVLELPLFLAKCLLFAWEPSALKQFVPLALVLLALEFLQAFEQLTLKILVPPAFCLLALDGSLVWLAFIISVLEQQLSVVRVGAVLRVVGTVVRVRKVVRVGARVRVGSVAVVVNGSNMSSWDWSGLQPWVLLALKWSELEL